MEMEAVMDEEISFECVDVWEVVVPVHVVRPNEQKSIGDIGLEFVDFFVELVGLLVEVFDLLLKWRTEGSDAVFKLLGSLAFLTDEFELCFFV